MKKFHILLGIMVALIWGGNAVAAKITANHLPPFMLAVFRFAVVAVCLLPFQYKMTTPWPKAFWIAQLWGTLYYSLFFGSLFMGASASVSLVTLQMMLPFTTLLGALFLGEKTTFLQLLGIMCACTGVYIMQNSPNLLEHTYALFTLLCAALVWSISSIVLKQNKEENPLALIGWVSLLSIPPLLVLSWLGHYAQLLPESFTMALYHFHPSWRFIISLLYMSIAATIVVNTAWLYLLKHNPASLVMTFVLPVPIFGMMMAAPLLGEPITLHIVIGAAMTILGTAIILFKARDRQIKPAEVSLND